MKRLPMSLVAGFAVALLTVILFFTIFGNGLLAEIHFISLGAILLAEGVTTVYAWFSKGSPRKVAAAVVSGLMVPYAAILSVVYIVNFPEGYGTYMGLYCAGMVIVNVLAFVLMHFDSGKNAENQRFQEAKSNMLGLRKIVKCIMADPAAQPYVSQLRAMEEKLHFSNDNVIAEEDELIRSLLLQLQDNLENPESDNEQLIKKIEKTIDKRNIITSRNV